MAIRLISPLKPLCDPHNRLETDSRLAGDIKGQKLLATSPIVPVFNKPPSNGPSGLNGIQQVTQVLFGETVTLLATDETATWIEIINDFDGYRGWSHVRDFIKTDTPVGPSNTQDLLKRVSLAATPIYTQPDIKSPTIKSLPMGSVVTLKSQPETKDKFCETDHGWIIKSHLCCDDGYARDPVLIAHSLCGAPYLWGGKSILGIDCSGLIQIALMACGLRVHRDSDLQFESLGRLLRDGEQPQRGDLAFFPGHVGIMWDSHNLLHANATHMAVTIDPIDHVIDWVKADMKETDTRPAFLGYKRLNL